MNIQTSKLIYRLQLRSDLWSRAFAELSVGHQTMAWGRIQRSYHGPFCDLIVQRMQYSERLPRGSDFSALHDWIVIDVPTELSQREILNKIADSRIRLGQLMVYLQPGLGADMSQWIGAVIEGDSISPLHQIWVVGAGIKKYRRRHSKIWTSPAEQTSAENSSRWSRTVGALGADLFSTFRHTEILFIGAGRLGSLLSLTMFRNGLRRATLVDPDKLESHNRDATFGNRPRDVGQSKVVILARRIHAINPDSIVTAIAKPVQDPAILDRFRRAAVVISCVDNDDCRRIVARYCAQLLKIHLDIGTIVRTPPTIENGARTDVRLIGADIRLILPGSCLACVGGLETTAENTSDARPIGEADWTRGGRVGSLNSINHIAIGTALQIYFDFLSEQITTSFWQRIEWVQGTGLRVVGGPVFGNPRCSTCHAN